MEEKENIDLGINPSKLNPTEERLTALVLTLKKYPEGLSSSKIKQLLPMFYENISEDSFFKKLQRDVDSLQELGFIIQTFGKDSKKKIYKLNTPLETSKIHFTKEELGVLSVVFSQESLENVEHELYTAFQKLFHKHMDFFPFSSRPKDQPHVEENRKVLEEVLIAIRNKTPLKITYYKTFIDEKTEKEIDPIHIIKRNNIDSYLIAYDRKAKIRKRFHLAKILKCQEISGEFILNHTVTEEDKNYHALNFKVHEPIEIIFKTNPQHSWKLETFLEPHPFSKKENVYTFHVTNTQPIFSFLFKNPDVVLEMSPKFLYPQYDEYLKDLASLYEDDVL